MITPDTIIHLLNIPLDETQKNQIVFNSTSDQYSYMYSKKIFTYNNFNYQRKDDVIKIDTHIDRLWNCNYVMYKNTNFSDKWFYAFITRKEYVNERVTNIYLKTDVYQTWFNDITLKSSFIEREHVSDDTIGLHTIPEQLEHGEYICTNDNIKADIGLAHPVVALSYDLASGGEIIPSTQYNGIHSGLVYYVCNLGSGNTLFYINQILASEGKTDALVSIFMVPDELTGYDSISWDYLSESGGLSYYAYKRLPLSTVATLMKTMSITKPYTSIDGYSPKNKKLFTFPYVYLLASNNNGVTTDYKYEYFSTNPLQFKIKGAITPGCSIRCIPQSYKNQTENNLEGVNGGKYPICSWASDVYTNWLTQNALNIGIDTASSLLQVIGGVGMLSSGVGAPAGASSILSGALGIGNTIGQVYQHKLVPPQVEGNLNSGDVTYSDGKTDFNFYKMNIKQEYAKIIDEYFNMFGYKVNAVKVPNIKVRPYWNYIKTIDCNIVGNVPQDDIIKIKEIFDNGCTFWKNGNNVGNYTLNNSL